VIIYELLDDSENGFGDVFAIVLELLDLVFGQGDDEF
jgi:hypothetical protein